jgi:glycosyltransferase involved in cell wall biosynthesis
VRTVYNGIDTHKFKPALVPAPSDPKPILAWVGRGPDLRAKRIDKLAAASHQIRDAGIRIWLAEPHGFEKVAAVAPEAARSLRETAEVWKGIEREDMPDFFRQVAQSGGAILSTSFSEGLPVALTEAQACGCPAIGTDVKGVNESVRPEHGGVLVPFDSPAGPVAEIVIDTLLDSERMKWRREACAKFARENFSAEGMVRGYLSIFREVLETPRAESVAARLRYWSSPVREWRTYIETRWSVGQSQFETSQNLAVRGEWELAAAAARASARTCPTLYLNRKRFMHLSSVFSHGQNTSAG